ncbi:MAG: hypothetical protein KAX57_01765 [Rhodoferax sp.]|uniref:hypothetical protein n=1 Tax=Rhodoferax sp. TaxID=50421 RepID=UPI001B40750C|nr:hypothetical protein [Rhodoferax sp.]MBP8285546.1 hypothetical protein [Rhodoferax sp.]MBP9148338.1 hypothetical protein [Rhodoferax sp.]MBP9738003.1 hypothetical protein [Rhodoferax sp.]
MNPIFRFAPVLVLVFASPSHAINAQYAKQLERSGCTQVTELQGCDIHKTKAENAKAAAAAKSGAASTSAPVPGAAKADNSASGGSPYTGNWIATGTEGATVAKIRIDAKEKVWVNGKPVKAKRSDGALVFKDKFITYTIQGDRRLKGEDTWYDSDAKSRGPIRGE